MEKQKKEDVVAEVENNSQAVLKEASCDYKVLEKRLGITFSSEELITRALTHRSALNANERTDYERLEFLGDAVLDLSISHLLCEFHPDANEGELSKMRAALVNTEALASIARGLEIGDFIKLGKGELSTGGADRSSILADVLEAIIGAVYYDSSYETAFLMIKNLFGNALSLVMLSDPKTELQEILHASSLSSPRYLLEKVEGPEHSPIFISVVLVHGEVAGRGKGKTKKASQQAAASEALKTLYASNKSG